MTFVYFFLLGNPPKTFPRPGIYKRPCMDFISQLGHLKIPNQVGHEYKLLVSQNVSLIHVIAIMFNMFNSLGFFFHHQKRFLIEIKLGILVEYGKTLYL